MKRGMEGEIRVGIWGGAVETKGHLSCFMEP